MAVAAVVMVVCGAHIEDTFGWSGMMGTLILLVAYVLTTIGAIRLVFVQRKLTVPMWQIVIPLLALVVLGYTLYRNVIPYPPTGAAALVPGRRRRVGPAVGRGRPRGPAASPTARAAPWPRTRASPTERAARRNRACQRVSGMPDLLDGIVASSTTTVTGSCVNRVDRAGFESNAHRGRRRRARARHAVRQPGRPRRPPVLPAAARPARRSPSPRPTSPAAPSSGRPR